VNESKGWNIGFCRVCPGWLPGLLALWLASAMAAGPGVDEVRFRDFGVGDGLSQATVRSMAQDARGFIWFGTQDGLNRFDGRSFQVYRHDATDPHSLSDNYIIALAADAEGGLWIATQSGGLNHLDPISGRMIRYQQRADDPHSLASDFLAGLHIDTHGRLWVQAESGELQWLDRDSGQFRPPPFQQPSDGESLRLLSPMNNGDLLLGSANQVWQWQPGMSAPELLSTLPGPDLDLTLAAVTDQAIWIGTDAGGLFELDPAGSIRQHWQRADGGAPGIVDNEIRSLLVDRQGQLWIGTVAGLSRIDPTGRTVISWQHDPDDPLGLSGARIVSLLEDQEGMIWAGSWTGGVSVYDPQTSAFTLIRNRPGLPASLPGNAIPAVLVNPDGTLWVSTLDAGVLVLFDLERGVLKSYRHDPADPGSLPHRMVGSLLHDDDGLLVGTLGGGLVRLDPDNNRFERLVDDPDRDVARTAFVERLQRDRSGTLWVSTVGQGLYYRCAACEGFEHYAADPADPASLASDDINGVLEASNGDFWVASRRKGLHRLDRDSGRFERFQASSEPGALRHNSVTGLYQARDGTIWIGTQGGGVHRMIESDDGPTFEALGRHEGLNAEAIGEIAEDGQGRIWVSTTAGLSRIDPDTLEIENFPFVDGDTGAGFFIGSIDRTDDGLIWFGGVRGLVRVDPDRVDHQHRLPKVVLTELLLSNQPVRPGSPALPRSLAGLDKLVVDHEQSLIAFEFTAPGMLRHGRQLRFAYRLLGLGTDWVETEPARAFATYTLLPPDDYRLQVRASILPGQWGPITELPMEVRPAPWARPEALLLYALAGLSLIFLAIWRLLVGLDRKASAQREIAASRERLRLALWGSRDELWEADLDKQILVRENRMDRLENRDHMARMTLAEFWASIHPDDLPALKQTFVDHVRGTTDHFEAEFRGRMDDGPWRWMLSRGRVTDRDERGRAKRLSGTTRDISRLKKTEEALRQLNEELESRVGQRTAELQQSNRTLQQALTELQQAQRYLVQTEKMAALGSLVAGIAHEINTPIGVGVTAASHLDSEARRFRNLLTNENPPDADRLRAFIELTGQGSQLILRNLKRADELVKSFKQVAVDQSSEQRRTFDLAAYIDEILTSLQPELKRSPHRIEREIKNTAILDSYPGALYQIMVNLIMNSLTHAFDEGQKGLIRIAAEADENRVRLVFSDDGRGMDKNVSERMFDPFFTTRRGQGGSGLGLHIVYNLVTKVLGGTIEASTAPGDGVRFILEIPRVAGEPD